MGFWGRVGFFFGLVFRRDFFWGVLVGWWMGLGLNIKHLFIVNFILFLALLNHILFSVFLLG